MKILLIMLILKEHQYKTSKKVKSNQFFHLKLLKLEILYFNQQELFNNKLLQQLILYKIQEKNLIENLYFPNLKVLQIFMIK